MLTAEQKQQIAERVDSCLPRKDELTEFVLDHGRVDAQLAPIWAEKLRHTYAKTFEVVYPELIAANGGVLPIDTSVDPAALEWEYFALDSVGAADWIDDDGMVMPSGAIKAERFTGKCHEIGYEYTLNVFDLERASFVSQPSLPLLAMHQKQAKRAHDALTNWVWLFGDSAKDIVGLITHPNITVALAPAGTSTSRLWSLKTNDEIADDVATLIDTVANDTIGAYFTGTVYMSRADYQVLRNRRLGAGDGFASLLGLLEDRYKGDASGQGKVEFKIMNECDASLRRDPRTNTDTSGLSGNFMLALPAGASKDELCFVKPRNFTQKPPQEVKYMTWHGTHSKIGGCKCQIPAAVVRLDFSPGS